MPAERTMTRAKYMPTQGSFHAIDNRLESVDFRTMVRTIHAECFGAEPKQLAAFLCRAANAHDLLVAAVKAALEVLNPATPSGHERIEMCLAALASAKE